MMKYQKWMARFVAVPLAMLLLAGCAFAEPVWVAPPVSGISTDDTLGNVHKPITQELISMLNHSPELKAMMEKSIALAREINPDPMTNPAQTLEQYYDYVDWAAEAMPWSILPGAEELYPKLYDQIDQSLMYFYFVNDQPLEELEGLGLYNNTLQYYEPYRTWLVNFAAQYGQYLNTTDSWKDEYYQAALEDERFHLHDGTYESPDNWKTFNQFFARYLASPDKRPITAPEDDSVLIAPADSQPQGVWEIDGDSRLVLKEGEEVGIKSGNVTSVRQLLAQSAYADAFAGGTFTHTFLDVCDYHRYHFPVSGTVKEVLLIPGDDAAGGVTFWNPETGRYRLESDIPGWQMIETRGCIVVETEEYGLVAILPIAMSQVSSVCFEENVKVGAEVRKGDELGCFLFGGSDMVMLFQKGVHLELTAPENGKGGWSRIFMGEEYGRLSRTE